jgi:hypothetical protein
MKNIFSGLLELPGQNGETAEWIWSRCLLVEEGFLIGSTISTFLGMA